MTISSMPKSLARARTIVTPTLAAASATLSPEIRRVVEYHWGWVDANGDPIQERGGKSMRATFAILSAEAVGKTADDAVAAAAAVEMTHDFTLLHDDIMDVDYERRGRPTAWSVFGVGAALCAGDALVPLAQRVLLEDESPRRVDALSILGEAIEVVIAGQALDLAFEQRNDVGVDEYVRMASMKTGALLGCATSIGALLAGGSSPIVDSLREFGSSLGLAFQAVDDWLGIWGDPDRVGKPLASDLRQRKASLPIVVGSSSKSSAGRELRALLDSDEPLGDAEIARGLEFLDATGAEEATVELARHELDRAYAALDANALAAEARDELCELASFVVDRNF
jgi:geranylgeranyl diphosphate synthase, type I